MTFTVHLCCCLETFGCACFIFQISSLYRTGDRPCYLIVFKMPYFKSASMTRCVPLDSRFVKDHLKVQISDDVDHVEELSGAGLALNAVELGLLIFIIIAALVKSYSALQQARANHHRSPVPTIGAITPSVGDVAPQAVAPSQAASPASTSPIG